MSTSQRMSPIVTGVIVTAGIFITLLGMRAASDLLAPFLMALVLAVVITPLLNWLRQKGAPSWLALLITILLFVGLILGFVWLITVSVQNFVESLPTYEERFVEFEQSTRALLDRFDVDLAGIMEQGLSVSTEMLQFVADFTGGLAAGLANWGLILATGIFLLFDGLSMPRKLRSVTSEADPGVLKLYEFNQNVRRFMQITAFIGFITALGNVLFLWFMGVDFAILWGILSFVLSFVPNIGFILSMIPPALMALLEFGVARSLIVITGFIIINGIAENIIKPRYIADDLDMSVGTSFVSLTLWAWVLGPIGAILAIPMTMLIQAVLNSYEETRWIAYLMGTGTEPYESEIAIDALPESAKAE